MSKANGLSGTNSEYNIVPDGFTLMPELSSDPDSVAYRAIMSTLKLVKGRTRGGFAEGREAAAKFAEANAGPLREAAERLIRDWRPSSILG